MPNGTPIRVDFLEQIVLGKVRCLTKFASHSEDHFAKLVMRPYQQALETACKLMEKDMTDMKARRKDIDVLFERIYEDICCKGRKPNPSGGWFICRSLKCGFTKGRGDGNIITIQAHILHPRYISV